MDNDVILCTSISLEEKESIRHSACPCWPRGFHTSLATIGMLRRSYALQTEAYTGRTMRGFCVVPACRANRLHLVRLARWQLSRVGSTQYTMELAVLASSGAAGLLLSPWCSSSSLVPIPRCLPTSITVAAGASLPWLLHRSDRIPLTRRSHC